MFKDEVEKVMQWQKVELDLRVLEEHPMGYQEKRGSDGAFSGDGDEDFDIGEGVVVSLSSWVKSTKSFRSGMMISLTFLEGLEEEAWVEAMEVEE
ncbi:hypothetical protein Tco_0729908 [Tanacetum coccineum]|uniref:Uncharacterized protein n=1 Tax=Tanacetum coccineum TaxID=301880 RepID=A0ABQ4YR36_9ASTR